VLWQSVLAPKSALQLPANRYRPFFRCGKLFESIK